MTRRLDEIFADLSKVAKAGKQAAYLRWMITRTIPEFQFNWVTGKWVVAVPSGDDTQALRLARDALKCRDTPKREYDSIDIIESLVKIGTSMKGLDAAADLYTETGEPRVSHLTRLSDENLITHLRAWRRFREEERAAW